MADADKTRQALLEAAYEEIYRHGFQAASLNTILERTGVTKGALYHHFGSKQKLGYAVIDEIISQKLDREWLTPIQQAGHPIDVMIEVIQQAGQQITSQQIDQGCPLNNLAQEMSPIDAGFRQRIDHLYQKWQESIEKILRDGQQGGTVNPSIDPADAALFILASLEGCMGIAKNAQSIDELKRCAQGLFGYLDSLRC
ncbi:MAG: TetR/AcrR family transcriptional regulator [Candidatus Thiodiazotropha taylori]|uniref:TetR/AcrR family transcriptional regulator n=1 Tax=Candidatus Thiodiazotropha taylori TaxID=2792791 RepID=A0A9E4N6H1_9GAMM|nr:TetR/AcrR family transcriptional regulator [Candidatus Thiodiazotropha taylori]MCG7956778.1 TetR/AcrR family transcriptional regulator [Candidatus Thiodiazotropha taylori]MCG7965427.1 TetR/AcrR family transcriptional regulator [Candidatus Thiodiazotropha taylori]MCG8043080.1 TetR/AcrR family transcriptional regulator [Candidatus Thiodiazotropha taylori]MCG8052529.1 TetR/AcrR family transcriptional regulator [Candidatus Thiodiazotropha taylori]